MSEYQFFAAPGSEFTDDDAAVLGQQFIELAQQEDLTPEKVVETARPPESPTHRYFEWNDAVAAEKYRLHQAGHYLRNVCVVPATHRLPIRAEQFITVKASTRQGTHRQAFTMSPAEHARRELLAWRSRYHSVTELLPVVELVEEAIERLEEYDDELIDMV